MKVSAEVMREIERAWERYRDEVEAKALLPNTKKTYLLHSENFVRWLRDEFEPGDTLPD